MWKLWKNKSVTPREKEASDLSEQAAGASGACPQCTKRNLGVDNWMTGARQRIEKIISGAKKVSIEEVLAIGHCVNNIVTHTRQYIADSKAAMEKNFTEQSATLDSYFMQSRETVEVQSETVQHALTLSDEISKAGEAVDKLAREAKLLALNATIESARLGTSGTAFGVISNEMNHLSDEITNTNRLIGGAIEAIRVSLPSIMKQTNLHMEKIEDFSKAMKGLTESIEHSMSMTGHAGENQLETILQLAYSAISHLQFQDPMVQDLERVNTILQAGHKALNTQLGLPFSEKMAAAGLKQSAIDQQGREGDLQTNPGDPEKTFDATVGESVHSSNPEAGDVLIF